VKRIILSVIGLAMNIGAFFVPENSMLGRLVIATLFLTGMALFVAANEGGKVEKDIYHSNHDGSNRLYFLH